MKSLLQNFILRYYAYQIQKKHNLIHYHHSLGFLGLFGTKLAEIDLFNQLGDQKGQKKETAQQILTPLPQMRLCLNQMVKIPYKSNSGIQNGVIEV